MHNSENLTLREAGVTLIDCDHRTPPAVEFGYPYVTIPQMKEGRLDLASARRIEPAHFKEWTRKALPEANDVVLSRRCNPGETAYVPPGVEFALGQNLVLLRADGKKIYPPFLRWLVRGEEWWNQINKNLNVGAVFDSLKCADVPKFELTIPPLPDQRSIASVLGALDDKIESNRRTSHALERLARAIFRAWFVDFEPVKAKAAGASSFPGMPQEAFDALPSRFVESELGMVPEGWEMVPLNEALEVNPSRRLAKGVLAPYLDMAQMPTDGHAPATWADREAGSGARFINGDTLVARITPCLENGKTAFVDFLVEGQVAWGSTEYIVLRPKPPIPDLYAYLLARTPEFRAFAIQNMTGTSGRQRVPFSTMSKYNVAVSPSIVMEAFSGTVSPLFSRSSASVRESRALAALRDYLLPKLLSGQLRVGETEERLGVVG